MVFTPFTLFTLFTPNYWCKGVNSVNSSYLHYLHMGWEISGVNNQIMNINTTKTVGGIMDHSNAHFSFNKTTTFGEFSWNDKAFKLF